MFFKKIKGFLACFLVATFIMPQTLFAYSEYIVAGGENIGLQINNNGIIVAGFYKIGDTYPGHDANLLKGDTIIEANGKVINNIDDFIDVIKESKNKSLNLVYKRNNKKKTTTLNLIDDNGTLKTGLYIKDMVSGIGTLTYIDPKTKIYGSLGHEVIESNTNVMLDVKDGKIYESTVTGIDKSSRGEPGCKNANVDSNKVYGLVEKNTKSGVFGTYKENINTNNLYKVVENNEIKLGSAKIITVIDKDIKETYDIEITKINYDTSDNKNILFEIKDSNLLNKTGGIVQGMSGSPIIQDNKIIGAVTNVVVNNPSKGYGIFITTMLKEGEK